MKRSITPTNLPIPAAPWEGNDILLREFSKQHITPSYINWLNNPEVLRYSNQRFRKHTYESCLEYLITFAKSHNKFFLIEERNSGNPLGTLTIYFNMHHHTADIGVMVGDSNSWGRGIGFDAFNTSVDVLTKSGEIRKITAGALAVNKAMVRIMEKAGLTWEATRHGQELVEGKPTDVVYYAKFCNT